MRNKNVKKQQKTISINEFNSAKSSVSGRLSRLRHRTRYGLSNIKSPIESIGVFSDEIDSMERTLQSMQKRLNNAKITIEL